MSLTESISKEGEKQIQECRRRFKLTESLYEKDEPKVGEVGDSPIKQLVEHGNTMRTYTFKEIMPKSVSSRQLESLEYLTTRELDISKQEMLDGKHI